VRESVKTSDRRAVEVPHAGASYNPARDDHQELLAKAVSYHIRKDEKEKILAKKARRESAKPGVSSEMPHDLNDPEMDVKEEDGLSEVCRGFLF